MSGSRRVKLISLGTFAVSQEAFRNVEWHVLFYYMGKE